MKKEKFGDDERDRHPFYSNWAKREWQKKIKLMGKEEDEVIEENRRKYQHRKKTKGNQEEVEETEI